MIGIAMSEGYEVLLTRSDRARFDLSPIGFAPLGPPVPSGKASYIPMLLRIGDSREDPQRYRALAPPATDEALRLHR